MKLFILVLLLSVFPLANAASENLYFVVEMKRPLNIAEIELVHRHKGNIELFDTNTKTPYFERTYLIKSLSAEILKKYLPVKLIEQTYQAEMYGITPAPQSEKLRKDQFFTYQWNLFNQGQRTTKLSEGANLLQTNGVLGQDINWKSIIAAMEANLKKSPIVAVIDVGVDWNHPELKNQILKNDKECSAQGEIIDSEEDRDNNGLKGDCIGWNFAARNMYDARRPVDETGHGTHIAGIISAETNNKIGISGISSKIKILPIKVTGPIDESNQRRTIQPLTDRIAKGILYAVHRKVDVINLSLGWTKAMDTKYLRESLDYALSQGVMIVAAAGNSKNQSSILPCSHYSVVCVGAVKVNGEIADFSNGGGEVDVLAPGDEILSTIPSNLIPLQLNVQGYDIRSGTSFAVAHVSAQAALLKSIYPEENLDTTYKRIVQTSQKTPDANKSNHGLIDFEASFVNSANTFVRPIFKNLSLVLYDPIDQSIKFPLYMRNFGLDLNSAIKVQIKSLTDHITLNQEYDFSAFPHGEVKKVDVSGFITDASQHHQLNLEIIIINSANETRSYFHQIRIGHDLLKSKSTYRKTVKFLDRPLPLGNLKDGKAFNFIQTVETLFPEDLIKQEFYLPRFNKESSQIEVKVLRAKESSIEEVAGTIVIPEATEVLNFYRLDVNRDGKEDYVVRTVNCSEHCDDPNNAKRYLQYSYWNEELKNLWGPQLSFWKFLPTLTNVDLSSQRFKYIEHPDFGTVAVAYFVARTAFPQGQQDLRPFELVDFSEKGRLLRIYPKVDGESVNLETQVVSNRTFTESVFKTLNSNMAPIESFTALKILVQSKADFHAGRLSTLFSVGDGMWSQNLLVSQNKEDEIKSEILSTEMPLNGYEWYPSLSLTMNEASINFVGLSSRNVIQSFHFPSQVNQSSTIISSAYSSEGTNEPPLTHIASFHDVNSSYTFFQTPANLVLLTQKDGKDISYKTKINRFSFLPNYIFGDTFFPVKSKLNGKLLPSLYVDESDIQNYLAGITLFNGEELVSPIGMSFFVPPICKALNPTIRQDGTYVLSLLCFNKEAWELIYVPFEL